MISKTTVECRAVVYRPTFFSVWVYLARLQVCFGASVRTIVARTQPEAMVRAKVECLRLDILFASSWRPYSSVFDSVFTGLDSPVRPYEGGWIGLFRPFRPGRPFVPQLTKEARTHLLSHVGARTLSYALPACFPVPYSVAMWLIDI